jgi:RNA polymerase sigma factor (sigma-70 family)
LVEVPLLEHAQGFVSPEVKIEAETTDVVRSIVSNLPEKQREVVVLYYCCEYTLPEIAKITGRNLNTIKYQFYAAHADLAQLATEGKLG